MDEEASEEWDPLLHKDSTGPVPPDDMLNVAPHAKLVDALVRDVDLDDDTELVNDTIAYQTHWNERRANQFHIPRDTAYWGPSQVSLPKDSIWGAPGSSSFDPAKPNNEKYTYNYDIADASDTYVYVLHEEGVWQSHVVSSHSPPCVTTLTPRLTYAS